MSDLVTICSLQRFFAKISKHCRVKPSFCSSRGYGSEELDMETSSPFSFVASFSSLASKPVFGLQF
jgi:hypothetical protein